MFSYIIPVQKGDSVMTAIAKIEAFGQEICSCCGIQNRYWWSKKGYDQEYGDWAETGLCPRCMNPKEPAKAMFEYKVICAWCTKLMEIKTSSDPKMQGLESHSICATCLAKMEA